MDINSAVLERYSEGAKTQQADLCCPIDYDTDLLKALPAEVIERDYGCGDPSRYVQPGDTVLDLGSGGGKICFMAAQIVGKEGHVIGVDMNNDMLQLARSYQQEMQDKFGARIDFVKGYIQDLKLDVDVMDGWLQQNPVQSAFDMQAFEQWQQGMRANSPLIEDDSVSLVLSNCVLNLVSDDQKRQLVDEIWRVVKPGGRIAISDIIADKPIPLEMKDDPELWSGCISGAFGEQEFLEAFAEAGFANVHYDKWDNEPWKVINDIQFRSVTIVASKPLETSAGKILYRGPYAGVIDEDGTFFERGERYDVDANTRARLLSTNDFIDLDETSTSTSSCCSPSSGCC